MPLHSARYNGVTAQSILDRYALAELTGQQWFSNATAQFWAFTLFNNATDGTMLWIYDARARSSGSAYPDGTINPLGNTNPIIGGGGNTPPLNAFAPVSNSFNETNTAAFLDVPAPASITAGNILVALIQVGTVPYKAVNPPSADWQLMAQIDGTSITPGLTIWAKLATGSEPGTYTWTLSGGITSAINGAIVQFTGNDQGNYFDSGLADFDPSPTLLFLANGITTTQPNDLVIGIWGCDLNPGGLLAVAPGFTALTPRNGYAFRYVWGYATFPQGPTGDQTASNTAAIGYSAGLVAIKAGKQGNTSGQTVQVPTQSQTPVLPGLFTMSYSTSPLILPGLINWLPPVCFYDWAREAALAIVQPGQAYSLAGISPEQAAWGSVTWLAIAASS